MIYVLIICYAVSPIDCREEPVRDRAEWCRKIDDARRSGDLWNAFVLSIDRRFPHSRQSHDRGC